MCLAKWASPAFSPRNEKLFVPTSQCQARCGFGVPALAAAPHFWAQGLIFWGVLYRAGMILVDPFQLRVFRDASVDLGVSAHLGASGKQWNMAQKSWKIQQERK